MLSVTWFVPRNTEKHGTTEYGRALFRQPHSARDSLSQNSSSTKYVPLLTHPDNNPGGERIPCLPALN